MRRGASVFLILPGLTASVVLVPSAASARPTGEPQGCANCHYESDGPNLAIAFSNATPQPGELIDITVDIEANNSEALRSGLFLASVSGEGTFTLVESEATRYAFEDGDLSSVTHAEPRVLEDGRAQFQLQWTAPDSVGVTDFVLWSMTGNSNGESDDDHHATIRQGIAHGCDALNYYVDFDGDGFGDEESVQLSCDPVPGRIVQGGDCNDDNVETFPGAPEVCNAVDDNCDGEADEGLEPGLYWPDPDGDGYAEAGETPEFLCNDTPGYANEVGDCAPDDPNVYPGAPELDNGEDDDCDDEIDEDVVEGTDGDPPDSGDPIEDTDGAGTSFGTAGADEDAEGCALGRPSTQGPSGLLTMLALFGLSTRLRRREG